MGEMADDLIDGFTCSFCGIYFKEPHGYPVLCHDCWVKTSGHDRDGLAKASIPELCS